MRDFSGKRSTTWSQDNPGVAAEQGPGKRTLTELLPAASAPVQRNVDAAAPVMPSVPRPTIHDLFGRVQRKASGAEPDTAAIHESAQRGIATASSPLPHAETIQRLFGRHDISGIQAHAASDAAASARAMGAEAYATGNHVVLGGRTDLHTVAHEAAHVVQQRGGVQLRGGVGEVGDAYERNADQVADAVVRGESAESLFGLGIAGTSPQNAPTVQLSGPGEHMPDLGKGMDKECHQSPSLSSDSQNDGVMDCYASGAGFSGVFNRRSHSFLARPSGNAQLANGSPANAVPRQGGHRVVEQETMPEECQQGKEDAECDVSGNVGFAAIKRAANKVTVRCISGQVNVRNYGDREAPDEVCDEVVETLQKRFQVYEVTKDK